MNNLKSWLVRIAPPAITIGLLLVVWEAAVRAGHVSERVLASPTQIIASMVRTWPDLMDAAAITTYEALTGFAIAIVAGVLIGIGLYLSKTLHRAFYPLFAALDVNAKIHEGESGRRLWAECVELGIESRKAILARCKLFRPY